MDSFNFDFPNWHTVTEQTANFFFSECEKRLAQTVLTFDAHREKVFKILGFLLPVSTAVVGYTLSLDYTAHPEKAYPSILFSIFQIIGILLFVSVLMPREIHSIGAEPKELIVPTQILEDEKLQYRSLVIALCARIQDKITMNKRQNTVCSRLILFGIISSGIVAPFLFFIFLLLG